MKSLQSLCILLFGLILFPEARDAQGQLTRPQNMKYFYRVSRLPLAHPDSTVLRVDISIPYSGLIFISQDSGYSAGVRVNLFVTDKDQSTIFEHSWQKKIFVSDYALTDSDTSLQHFSTVTRVAEGKYKIVLEAVDENIGIPEYNKFDVKIDDHSRSKFILGDILLYKGLHDFSNVDYRSVDPAPSNVCRDDFTLFTQVTMIDTTINLRSEINWYENNRKISKDPVIVHRNGRLLTLFQNYLIKETPYGRFDVQFRVYGKDAGTESSELTVEVLKNVAYFSEESIDMAIEQMKYIGEGELWDSLRRADDLEEKKYYFKRFWEDYYPSADPDKNPAQEEYFKRVRHTNRFFNEGIDGWRTDRGRVYILYGPPSDVERTTDDMMRRVEIWTYQNVERQYVFVDVNGSGTFRLIRVN